MIENSLEDKDQIIKDAINGDEKAFTLLYQENIKKIYNYIYYRTGNPHEAEDLTARVFQRALAHIGKYQRTDVPFSAWLYRIAHNLVANWHRDNSRKREISLEGQSELHFNHEVPEKEVEDKQEIEFLLNAIHQLSNDRQMVVILKFVDDLSNKEIGEILNKSEGAIKSLYHRTLLELKQIISNNQGE
jgi:RNA polymerase sigma-70 factor (ECF subfamily)